VSHERRPIIFAGPSLGSDRIRRIVPDVDLRPPVRRGDLDDIGGGAIVGIIDGLFHQNLAVSPGEVRDAISRGVTVLGAASMGALRAAEVPAVIGIGRIFEMYHAGVIERDDEVAVLVDPDSYRALSVPMVNVRFAVERLVRTGTVDAADGAEIIDAALRLHYTERTYRTIVAGSRLAGNRDSADLIALLESFDLKADDAQLLVERIAGLAKQPPSQPVRTPKSATSNNSYARVKMRESSASTILIWESGDDVGFDDLVMFLKVTGKFDELARHVIGRMAAAGPSLYGDPAGDISPAVLTSQALLDSTRAQWGWQSPEEAHVTMRDLGLGLDDIADSLDAEVSLRQLTAACATSGSAEFLTALRVQLWLDDLSLKRETLRLGALQYFAALGQGMGPLTAAELRDARRCLARVRGVFRWNTVISTLTALGLRQQDVDATVTQLALCRRAAAPLVEILDRPAQQPLVGPPVGRWQDLVQGLASSPKAPGSRRFTLDEAAAVHQADAIAAQMGVVRVGLVGELDTLGVYIAQAFGQRSGWSSSFSSGKSETREGARVGSIMEEVEIHAQDAYEPEHRIRAAYAGAGSELELVDPRELGLPFDTCYSPAEEMDWSPCVDLVTGEQAYVPTACLVGDREPYDILYCPRLGGKIFSSSGLGSGFSMAEAVVHAGAEYIERHAYRLAEIELDNPGRVGVRQFWFVDEQSLPEAPARIISKYTGAGMCVRILDITSEVAIPTFYVRVFDDLFDSETSMSADGFACHPDPEVAVTMALLEAAQTRGGFIAGGREDYSLHARSLGRHERPRTAAPASQLFWFSNDRPTRSFECTRGLETRDTLDELAWMVERVVAAGAQRFLVADYTMSRIRPAAAARVLIPGLETTNPLFTGPRARATVIRDLLPRPTIRTT
jgi:ribosomal protein S12 methylthiotransferase accessory factor